MRDDVCSGRRLPPCVIGIGVLGVGQIPEAGDASMGGRTTSNPEPRICRCQRDFGRRL